MRSSSESIKKNSQDPLFWTNWNKEDTLFWHPWSQTLKEEA